MSFYPNVIQISFIFYPYLSLFCILGHLLLSTTPILGNGLQWLRTSSSLPQFDWQTSRPSSFERNTHSGKDFHKVIYITDVKTLASAGS